MGPPSPRGGVWGCCATLLIELAGYDINNAKPDQWIVREIQTLYYTECIHAAFSTLEVKLALIYPFILNKPNIKSCLWSAGKTSVRYVMYKHHF